MIEPKIGEKVTIGGVTYECKEPQHPGWMWKECDLYHDRERKEGCLHCKVQCNAYYRKDGKHIILKRIGK